MLSASIRGRHKNVLIIAIAFATHAAIDLAPVHAQFKDEIGYNRFVNELSDAGQSLPTGAGIRVGIVEAPVSGHHSPNTSDVEFAGKNVTPAPAGAILSGTSNHATTVLKNFVGNSTSMVPGVNYVEVYEANVFGNSILNSSGNPPVLDVRVLNHSYVGSANPVDQLGSVYYNSRMDYMINRDQITNVVGLKNNGQNVSSELFNNSFNSISVGLSNGAHTPWTTNGLGAGRMKPDLVAPSTHTSFAAPIVSSAATLLHAVAIENDLTNAARPEAMKAILMAGADKNGLGSGHIWQNSSSQPLDAIYGAGEVDVYNSYKILTAGEHDGTFSFDVAPSALRGWDTARIGDAQELFWNFEVGEGLTASEVSILLTWNAQFSDEANNFDLSRFSLADMHLSLYANGDMERPLWQSDSKVDNVEHIYMRDLASGSYTFGVFSNIESDFAIAWNVSTVPEPTSMAMLLSAISMLGGRLVARRRHTDI